MLLIYLLIKWHRISRNVISLLRMHSNVVIFWCIVLLAYLGYLFSLFVVYDLCFGVFDEIERIWVATSYGISQKSKANNKSKLWFPNWAFSLRTKFKKRYNKDWRTLTEDQRIFSKTLKISRINIIIKSCIYKFRKAWIKHEQDNRIIYPRN